MSMVQQHQLKNYGGAAGGFAAAPKGSPAVKGGKGPTIGKGTSGVPAIGGKSMNGVSKGMPVGASTTAWSSGGKSWGGSKDWGDSGKGWGSDVGWDSGKSWGKDVGSKGKDKGKGKGKRKGPTGPNQPRTRITEAPVTGEVLEWKGKYGWVQPTVPIEHPMAQKHGGRIYVSMSDLQGGLEQLTAGTICQFHVFSDASGLGCEEVLGS
mmetsp:Transcript_3604/g.8376  ORF Transcript_3604/g.8376 Transcript_3604/m.8376 type:complete len:208 (-) Transcript_3604:146-769(-)|eukprot:CAMPEP_0171101636 /NCGR_PEP_ID=MMETSP0766_2-20121228/55604_1 /TAXON_ID=439317 /ORGANISM="Gambierdiscus australes, Strain CAWD 149" /LENGTH=207 /DNA_ID=CAMNT_0011561747 /DNA_START=58 /DNA_END=681 /DNA_ORIENTATION=-